MSWPARLGEQPCVQILGEVRQLCYWKKGGRVDTTWGSEWWCRFRGADDWDQVVSTRASLTLLFRPGLERHIVRDYHGMVWYGTCTYGREIQGTGPCQCQCQW